MSILRQIQGIDVSDYNVIKLDKDQFQQVDLEIFTPFRMHFAIHALQFQRPLPSQSSILRSERRNQRKMGETAAQEITGRGERREREGRVRRLRVVYPKRMAGGFAVPSKYGSKPSQHRRKINFNQFRQVNRQINFNTELEFRNYCLDQGIPLIQLPSPSIGVPFLMGHPAFSMALFPLPSMYQSLSSPMIPRSLVPLSPTIPTALINESNTQKKQAVSKMSLKPIPAKQASKPPKPKSIAFKVQSPQEITLKCARRAFKEELQKYGESKPVVISNEAVRQVPAYFRKKKASQKRRRLEKHELITKNRKKLVQIFGRAIFSRGWPLSRREIRQALGIQEEENQAEFEGVSELMEEKAEGQTGLSTESAQSSRMSEVEKSEGKGQVKFTLLVESVALKGVPQFVMTG